MASQASTTTEKEYEYELERRLFGAEAPPMKLPKPLWQKIKNSKHEFIATGGFAMVYKAHYDGHPLTVKKMINQAGDDRDFCQELNSLRRLTHKNIVRLLAFYSEAQLIDENSNGERLSSVVKTGERVFLFEHLPNGTLADYIKKCFPKQESTEASQGPQISNGEMPADNEDAENNGNRKSTNGESLASDQLKIGTSPLAKTSQVESVQIMIGSISISCPTNYTPVSPAVRPSASLSGATGPDTPQSCGKAVPPGTSKAEHWCRTPSPSLPAKLIVFNPALSKQGTYGDLNWTKHYQIIKGICEGLNHIHQTKVVHGDLNPNNIMLDEKDLPKIVDFGLSRLLDKEKAYTYTLNIAGTKGYMAPEYDIKESGNYKITHKWDLFSLGRIMMKMLTGSKKRRPAEDVLYSWKNMQADLVYEQVQQIEVCAGIALSCTNKNPDERPSIEEIVGMLPTEETPAGGPKKFHVDPPSLLCFPFEPNKVATCLLELTNENKDEYVAFRLMNKSGGSSFLRLPLYGLVPPQTPYTLTVTTKEKEIIPEKGRIVDLILNSAIIKLGDHKETFKSQPDKFFEEMGNAVEDVKFKALFTPLTQHISTSSSERISPTTKIHFIQGVDKDPFLCFDTNQDMQWVITAQKYGSVGIWDYKMQKKVHMIKVSDEDGYSRQAQAVTCLKFITRKEWIVAGTSYGYVHVYKYSDEKIILVKSFKVSSLYGVNALAVHPTQPYLLLAGKHVELWSWDDDHDDNWNRDQTFDDIINSEEVYHVALNTNGLFACILRKSGSKMRSVMICSLKPLQYEYDPSGHTDKVNCLDFFAGDNHEFLVTGSDDETAKIWCLDKRNCVHTLGAFISPVMSVMYQSDLQTLIIGSKDGAVYLWTNCGQYSCPPTLQRIINICIVGAVYHLTCVMGRVVIGQKKAIAIMDYSEEQYAVDTIQHAGSGAGTCKEITGSIIKLLDVHPLQLRFPFHPNDSISCSLHLRNNTDDNVAFRLVDRSGNSPLCFTDLPLYGIVPCRSTYILIVTTKMEMKQKKETDFDLIIESYVLGDKHTGVFVDQSESDTFLEEAKTLGRRVQPVILKAVYAVDDGRTAPKNISVKYYPEDLCSLDAHPTEPWILTGHDGYFLVWNHQMKDPMSSFDVSRYPVAVKFIATREWIIARAYDLDSDTNYVHVYDLLLDWNFKDTICDVGLVTIDMESVQETTKSKTAASFCYSEIQVCRLDSSSSEHALRNHLERVKCFNFITRGDKQCLITGSMDRTVKIWDLQERECICTLEARSPVLCVLVHPNLPVLITGTLHGIIQMWSSNNFRLKRTVNLGGGGPVVSLGCLMGSRRIVVAQWRAISTMEIRDDEALQHARKQRRREKRAEGKRGQAEATSLQPKVVMSRMKRRRERRRAAALAKRAEAEVPEDASSE